MTREEFIKQRCEIDKITEEEFKKRYRVVKCNCGQSYYIGYRCLDLDDLLKENQELKKQLEELEKENFNLRENIYIDKISFSSEGKNIKELIEMPTYEDLINQQKEFIEYLENEININPYNISDYAYEDIINTILSKYKEIIGGGKNDL